MTKHKKTTDKEPIPYHIEDEPGKDTLAEPEIIYGHMQDPIAARTIGIMGMQGKKDFAAIKNDNDFINLIRAGIPKQAMNHLMEVANLTLTEMAAIVHTSDRTLRRYSAQEKLTEEQSERMVELARLYSRGEEVFGAIGRFREWMDTALLAFGNKKPKAFLDTSLGIQMIMDELGRIEHGVLA